MPITDRIQRGFSEQNPQFIICTGIGLLGILLVSVIISRLVYSFDLGFYEAFSWMPAKHLLEGKNPYSYAFTSPYSMSPYGVVYYVLLAVGIKLFGFQLWWGRILSILGFIVCIWAVTKITEKLTKSKKASLFAVLVSLALFPSQMWIAVMRPDLIGVAFSFSALCLIFTSKKNKPITSGRLIAVILLCAAAFFTKHTFLLPVVIIVLRFWQLNKWRESFLFCSVFIILAVGGMLLLNYTSSGGYIWQHFIHAQGLPFSLGRSVDGVFQMAKEPTTIVFVAALLIFAYKKREIFYRINRDKLINALRSPKLLILFYFFLSFSAASLSYGLIF